jgi:hypothetical protein
VKNDTVNTITYRFYTCNYIRLLGFINLHTSSESHQLLEKTYSVAHITSKVGLLVGSWRYNGGPTIVVSSRPGVNWLHAYICKSSSRSHMESTLIVDTRDSSRYRHACTAYPNYISMDHPNSPEIRGTLPMHHLRCYLGTTVYWTYPCRMRDNAYKMRKK